MLWTQPSLILLLSQVICRESSYQTVRAVTCTSYSCTQALAEGLAKKEHLEVQNWWHCPSKLRRQYEQYEQTGSPSCHDQARAILGRFCYSWTVQEHFPRSKTAAVPRTARCPRCYATQTDTSLSPDTGGVNGCLADSDASVLSTKVIGSSPPPTDVCAVEPKHMHT